MPERNRITSLLLAGSLLPVTAIADSVYLKNGESFEGVEAVVTGDIVQIDLPIGSLRLPMSKVDRVEEVDSTLGEYRARESRLKQTDDAAGWLDLARWARANDFDKGARKAALLAARLEPELPDLEPMMAGIGYVFDEKTREWIPYADSMRRRGLVEDGADWVTPEEKRERADGRVERTGGDERVSSRADDHLDKALDILAAAVSKEEPPTTVVVQQGPAGGYYPGVIAPGFIGGGFIDPGFTGGFDGRNFPTFFGSVSAGWEQLARRQPASFIPMQSTAPRIVPHVGGRRHR
jgi:hypothetical protein